MPLCGTTFDKNSVPTWTRGDFRWVLNTGTNPPRRFATAVAARHSSQQWIPRRALRFGVRELAAAFSVDTGLCQLAGALLPRANSWTIQSFRPCHMEASKSINESESLFQETVEAPRGTLPSFAANCNSFILSRRDSAWSISFSLSRALRKPPPLMKAMIWGSSVWSNQVPCSRHQSMTTPEQPAKFIRFMSFLQAGQGT